MALALSWVATWENERAVAQALKGIRDPNTGRLWDTCFRYVFEKVLAQYPREKTPAAADTPAKDGSGTPRQVAALAKSICEEEDARILEELEEKASALAASTPPADPRATPEESARNWWVIVYGKKPRPTDGNWLALKCAFTLACADAELRGAREAYATAPCVADDCEDENAGAYHLCPTHLSSLIDALNAFKLARSLRVERDET